MPYIFLLFFHLPKEVGVCNQNTCYKIPEIPNIECFQEFRLLSLPRRRIYNYVYVSEWRIVWHILYTFEHFPAFAYEVVSCQFQNPEVGGYPDLPEAKIFLCKEIGWQGIGPPTSPPYPYGFPCTAPRFWCRPSRRTC